MTSNLFLERKEKAEDLISRTASLKGEIDGKAKLMRKLVAENDFLNSLDKKGCGRQILEGHLKSSNLTHLESILTTAETATNVVSILKKVPYKLENEAKVDIVVDVESNSGKFWFKVFARNPYALHSVWQGLGQFGDKDVCSLASNYQKAAMQNLVEFRQPIIIFLFAGGVTESVAEDLKLMNIKVIGNIISDPPENNCGKIEGYLLTLNNCGLSNSVAEMVKEFELSFNDTYEIEKVNLDITTLIAYVSALTNGGCHFEFDDDVLSTQAREECEDPVLPKLNSFFKNKQLFVCDTAMNDFNNILKTIGGREEMRRAVELMERLTVVKDEPSQRSMLLVESASIKMRSKIIFGTGDTLKAKTVTANRSFVRAAHDQQVDFSVFFHSSRALTERKQPK
eukprot:gene5226-5883_t